MYYTYTIEYQQQELVKLNQLGQRISLTGQKQQGYGSGGDYTSMAPPGLKAEKDEASQTVSMVSPRRSTYIVVICIFYSNKYVVYVIVCGCGL